MKDIQKSFSRVGVAVLGAAMLLVPGVSCIKRAGSPAVARTAVNSDLNFSLPALDSELSAILDPANPDPAKMAKIIVEIGGDRTHDVHAVNGKDIEVIIDNYFGLARFMDVFAGNKTHTVEILGAHVKGEPALMLLDEDKKVIGFAAPWGSPLRWIEIKAACERLYPPNANIRQIKATGIEP